MSLSLVVGVPAQIYTVLFFQVKSLSLSLLRSLSLGLNRPLESEIMWSFSDLIFFRSWNEIPLYAEIDVLFQLFQNHI